MNKSPLLQSTKEERTRRKKHSDGRQTTRSLYSETFILQELRASRGRPYNEDRVLVGSRQERRVRQGRKVKRVGRGGGKKIKKTG
ncbi:hypothetical protein E2C01_088128 [Portunus trituberculatus]|uniref:Uncharacterized protein n=1 Tax=Portunus trituberculatus TaxID=210409 RepID=A0A5B7JF49_PORTR|nr:hypothetical protein [Portunus trituberculatus]